MVANTFLACFLMIRTPVIDDRVEPPDKVVLCYDMENARRYPVLTIASGPANSIRGGGFLSGLSDAVVIDIGGATTDFGILQKGFPRESGVAVTISGVRTNFRIPDVISIGLGGGSIVREKDSIITIGPDSVGSEITRKALVFGGDTLTATDIAVRMGLAANIGDVSKAAHIDKALHDLHDAERACNSCYAQPKFSPNMALYLA
jgi:N-methylhydantoinase A/oxoprolinase/acetone carboxylase beta subunit